MDKTSKLIGILHQAACDAVEAKLKQMADKEGNDPAYWDYEITVGVKELGTGFDPLHEYVLIKKYDIEKKIID